MSSEAKGTFLCRSAVGIDIRARSHQKRAGYGLQPTCHSSAVAICECECEWHHVLTSVKYLLSVSTIHGRTRSSTMRSPSHYHQNIAHYRRVSPHLV